MVLLGISLQMHLNPNDVPERTGDARIFTSYHQPYVALLTFQVLGVVDNPVIIPAVNNL